ncbi:hypothetical protein ACO0LM_11890 [Undibacterium sp. Di26W]|uniref:hypothetical protein n=1 Tax=Undibacterium sp. Di26W TaxID=3413035 RepID=UPI003BF0108F
MRIALVFVLAVLSSAAQAEVYKCKIDGNTVWRDKPCPGAGTPVEVKYERGAAPSVKSETSASVTSARDESTVRIKKKLITDDIERNQEKIRQLNQQMDVDLAALKNRSYKGGSDLTAATKKQADATESISVANSYANKIKEVEADSTRLRAERDALDKK